MGLGHESEILRCHDHNTAFPCYSRDGQRFFPSTHLQEERCFSTPVTSRSPGPWDIMISSPIAILEAVLGADPEAAAIVSQLIRRQTPFTPRWRDFPTQEPESFQPSYLEEKADRHGLTDSSSII